MKQFFLIICIYSLFVMSCKNQNGNSSVEDSNANPEPPLLPYQVVNIYPHDTSSYTQGLVWFQNFLYEGTGEYGTSKIAKIDLKTGKPLQEYKIKERNIFGEGITVFNNKLYQLTWKNNVVYVYNITDFKKIKEWTWPYEGWGITNDNKNLIISTGSNNLYFVNADNFKIEKIVGVTDNYGPVSNLNELEYVQGFIYANVYETDYIVKIDPATGKIVGKIDFQNLREKNGITVDEHQNVLNGIAYDSVKNSLYITGKLWPALFEIKL